MYLDQVERAKSRYMGSFIPVSKELVRLYGLEIPTFIQILINHHDNLLTKGLITEDNNYYFYVESDKLEEKTSLYYRQQLRMFKILEEDFQIIKTKVQNIPPKKFIYFDFEAYDDLLTGKKIVEKHLCNGQRKNYSIKQETAA